MAFAAERLPMTDDAEAIEMQISSSTTKTKKNIFWFGFLFEILQKNIVLSV